LTKGTKSAGSRKIKKIVKQIVVQKKFQQPRRNRQPKKRSGPRRGQRIQGGQARSTTVSKREYIGDITTGTLSGGSTLFDSLFAKINPGNSDIFPWLSNVSGNYQYYRFKKLQFEYVSTSAVALNSTNTALGTVVMSTDYNATDIAFTSKQTQENYNGAIAFQPSQSRIHKVQTSQQLSPLRYLWVATSDTNTSVDQLNYYLGNFQISTVGMQAANIKIGELHVSYEIELNTPRLPQGGVSAEAVGAHFTLNGSTPTSVFGNTIEPDEGSDPGFVAITNTLYFPELLSQGYFIINQIIYDTGNGLAAQSVTLTLTNCAAVSYLNDGTATYGVTGNTGQCQATYIIQITNQNAVVVWNRNITSAGTIDSFGDMTIAPLPSGLFSLALAEENPVVARILKKYGKTAPQKSQPILKSHKKEEKHESMKELIERRIAEMTIDIPPKTDEEAFQDKLWDYYTIDANRHDNMFADLEPDFDVEDLEPMPPLDVLQKMWCERRL